MKSDQYWGFSAIVLATMKKILYRIPYMDYTALYHIPYTGHMQETKRSSFKIKAGDEGGETQVHINRNQYI